MTQETVTTTQSSQQPAMAAQESAQATETLETPAPSQEQSASPSQEQVETQPKEDPDFVRRFNALARKEREIREKEQQFRSQMGQFEAYQKERELIKEKPLDFLEKHGWNFNQLAEYVLNDKKPTADMQVSELQKRIDQLENMRKQEIEDRQKTEQEQKNQEAINNFKTKIKSTVSEKLDNYELINHFGEFDLVYDVISSYYANHGQILDIDKAAEQVESYLEQQFEKAAATNKFKKRFNLAEHLGEAQKPSSEPAAKQTMPQTLTNDYVANSPSPTTSEPAPYLSEEESKAKAADLIRQHFLKKQGYTKT